MRMLRPHQFFLLWCPFVQPSRPHRQTSKAAGALCSAQQPAPVRYNTSQCRQADRQAGIKHAGPCHASAIQAPRQHQVLQAYVAACWSQQRVCAVWLLCGSLPQEDFVIQFAAQQCSLESVVGPFSFNIRGGINGWEPETGKMLFQFTAVDILLLGKAIWTVQPNTKPKTYTFYFQQGNIAAARSSAGGLALLRK